MNFENVIKTISAGIGAILGYLYGGWSVLLGILLAFVVADYITGVISAAIAGRLSSEIGGKGIAKKILIFIVVAIAHLVDKAMGSGATVMDAVVFFYLANELLSIIENVGETGVPIPDILRKKIELLKEKSDNGNDKKNGSE